MQLPQRLQSLQIHPRAWGIQPFSICCVSVNVWPGGKSRRCISEEEPIPPIPSNVIKRRGYPQPHQYFSCGVGKPSICSASAATTHVPCPFARSCVGQQIYDRVQFVGGVFGVRSLDRQRQTAENLLLLESDGCR